MLYRCDACAGWSVFMKRRTAVNKIDSLPEADEEQLRRLNDVCAICYQEMKSAKITRCRHFFHGVCLRKWLYVQDKCPLCHKILHSVDPDDSNGTMRRLMNQDGDQDRWWTSPRLALWTNLIVTISPLVFLCCDNLKVISSGGFVKFLHRLNACKIYRDLDWSMI